MTRRRDDAPVTTTGTPVKITSSPTQSTPPVVLALSLKRLLIEHFDFGVLYELAWMKQHECPEMIARQSLSDASIDELAEMLTAGLKPTIGWFSRNTIPNQGDPVRLTTDPDEWTEKVPA